MNKLRKFASQLKQLWINDSGAEVVEYVLIVGLILVATITTLAAFGTKVVAKWTSVNSSM